MSDTVEMILAIIVFSFIAVVALPFLLVAIKDSFLYECASGFVNLIETFCKWWLEAWRYVLPKKETKENAAGLPETAKQTLFESFMKGADK